MMAKKLLGDAVKEERLRRNLSQNALAEMVHVSLRTISDIENYNGNPRFENLYFLKYIFTVSVRSKTENRNYIFKYMQHNFFRQRIIPENHSSGIINLYPTPLIV